jgi:dTDP-4-dehydrorhamnose 3,5-epimerase
MEIELTGIDQLLVLKPKVFGDSRGYFFESYSALQFESMGLSAKFVQDNESMSSKGVLRGLHFQRGVHAQAKLVRVVRGSVYDVAVDLRPDSPTFGNHFGAVLSSENKKMMFIPEGFAHGFLTLEDHTVFQYKVTNYYNKESEGGIIYNDVDLNINWPEGNYLLSEKDLTLPTFNTFKLKKDLSIF